MRPTPAIDRSQLRNAQTREPILALLEAGLAAVSPEAAVDRCVATDGKTLCITDPASRRRIERNLETDKGRVFVVGAGKASVRMAARLESILGPQLAGGVVVAPIGTPNLLRRVRLLAGDHPLPKAASEEAGLELLRFAQSLGRRDFAVCCVSGGASSLIAVPHPGLQPGDLQAVSSELLGAGVPVGPMNIVRRHLSLVHGGRLAASLLPASFVTLLLSDVAGDIPETIGSGPTVADPSTYAQALDIVDRYGVRDRIPRSVVRVLQQGDAGLFQETIKPGGLSFQDNPAFLAASAHDAVSAMAGVARAVGVRPIALARPLGGDADALGERLGRLALRLSERSRLLIAHGETTVIVRGAGRGGRNQQAAAAAARQLLGSKRAFVASFASDGIDGATPAAGAIVDGMTAVLTGTCGRGPTLEQALADNDCHAALLASRDLLWTGPTGTNVADLFLAGAITTRGRRDHSQPDS